MSQAKRIGVGAMLLMVLGAGIAVALLYQQGYRAYVVRTGSMAPTIPAGDLVIDRPVSGDLRVGDVITFQISPTELVTHRVTSTARDAVHTKGDANTDPDVWSVPERRIVGVVDSHLPNMGYIVVFLQQPAGVAATMTLGLALLLLWGLFFPTEPLPNSERKPSRTRGRGQPLLSRSHSQQA